MSKIFAWSLVLAGLACAAPVCAGEHDHHQHAAAAASDSAADPHAQHRQALQNSAVQVERRSYDPPALVLRDNRGGQVDLSQLLATDRPVAVNFIFTTCTTICPVMTATMLQLQRTVAGTIEDPLFVSISIDPDHDTAEVMQRYAERYGAEWTFLTGDRDVVMAVLTHFDAWRGNKMNHEALTLLRRKGQEDWTRVVGLASATQLASIWRGEPG